MSVSSEPSRWRTWSTQPLNSLSRRVFALIAVWRWEDRLAGVLVMLYVAFAIGFSSGPIFESIDEYEHLMMVRRRIEVRGLPHALGPVMVLSAAALLFTAIPIVALFDVWDTSRA
jgi:hypothetical protein